MPRSSEQWAAGRAADAVDGFGMAVTDTKAAAEEYGPRGDRASQVGRGLRAADKLFDADEVQGVLHGAFYGAERPPRPTAPKPDHYKVICISLYRDALDELDRMVQELKRRGYTKANRSALIRHALSTVDLDKVPRGL